MRRAQSAGTKYPNTPESDKQLYVWHEVTMTDGSKVDIQARDPLDAMDKVNCLEELKQMTKEAAV